MPAPKKIATHRSKPKAAWDDTANWAWLRSWTASVDRKLNLIFLGVKQILAGGGAISPELETAFNELAKEIQIVDDKVPDKPSTQETSQ